MENVERNVRRYLGTDEVLRRRTDASEYNRKRLEAQHRSRQIQIEVDAEILEKMKQQHTLRRLFFWWAVSAITAVLVGSGWFMWLYFQLKGDRVEPQVILGWLTTCVVETLGLGYIIANYLFDGSLKPPGRNGRRPRQQAD